MIRSRKRTISNAMSVFADISSSAGTGPRAVRTSARLWTGGLLGEAFLPVELRASKTRLKAGMTMIELVAALALFVIILGVLFTIMNTATSLWSSSRSQQREETTGRNILDLLTDDLQQAVTDSGEPTISGSDETKPTFILATPTADILPTEATIILGFARHASPRTPAVGSYRLSLDAVFYTLYKNALFRHTIPLFTSFSHPETEPLGKLLDAALRDSVDDKTKTVYDNILAEQDLPVPADDPTVKGNYVLLAKRVKPVILATLPEEYVRKNDNTYKMIQIAYQTATGLWMPPQYDRLTADVLPDQLDISLHLFDKEDWSNYPPDSDSSVEANLKRKQLGMFFAKRITFPSKGGSRLP